MSSLKSKQLICYISLNFLRNKTVLLLLLLLLLKSSRRECRLAQLYAGAKPG